MSVEILRLELRRARQPVAGPDEAVIAVPGDVLDGDAALHGSHLMPHGMQSQPLLLTLEQQHLHPGIVDDVGHIVRPVHDVEGDDHQPQRQRRLVEVCPALSAWLEPFRRLTTGKVCPITGLEHSSFALSSLQRFFEENQLLIGVIVNCLFTLEDSFEIPNEKSSE